MNSTMSILAKVARLLLVSFNLTLMVAPALADDECEEPIADWQPREILKQRLEQQGWVVQRIRIDDGCYEVRALNERGRRIKATFSPASLILLKLKVKDDKHPHSDSKPPNKSISVIKQEQSK